MGNNNTEVTNEYGADQIQILEGLEAVRKRPGMYIGTTASRGLHHLVYEIVDNSVDEALAGYCSHIEVTINDDNSITVKDNGRGIPVGINKKAGIPAVEVVFTILHAGGKFGGGGYKVSGGLHGVGASVVNALSEWLEVEIRQGGKVYKQRYERGKTIYSLKEIGTCDENDTGTKVTFLPDKLIFTETTIYDYEIIKNRIREMAFLTKGLRISLNDERSDEHARAVVTASMIEEAYEATEGMDDQDAQINKLLNRAAEDAKEEISEVSSTGERKSSFRKELSCSFCYEGGIKEYVEHLNSGNSKIYDDILYFEGEKNGVYVEVAMQHNDSYKESIYTYVNNINTPEGGTHLQGFRNAITKTFNDYARNSKILKDNDNSLAGEDVREGLTAIISVKIEDPQFEGQTKQKLGNSEARQAVDNIVAEKLTIYLEQNPTVGKAICEKALLAQRARAAARNARAAARKTALDVGSLPGKLADCSSKNPDECEIYIVEGDSAGGSAKTARDRRTQAILPLRGKILNVEKARADKVFANAEIKAMITCFGTGIHDDFDITKLKYNKIIIMSDADVDGAHIATLLLTFIYRYMPDLIKEGHVFIAKPPLYQIKKNKEAYYAYSDEELAAKLKELGSEKNYVIQRYKGLGEMDAEQLWDTTMDPKKRILIRVNMNDDVKSELDLTFSTLMGDQVDPRREFIEKNAKFVQNLDI